MSRIKARLAQAHKSRRKRTAREAHKASSVSQTTFGHKAKMMHKRRHAEKVQMKKTLKAYDERNVKQKDEGAVGQIEPSYLMDRDAAKVSRNFILSLHPAILWWRAVVGPHPLLFFHHMLTTISLHVLHVWCIRLIIIERQSPVIRRQRPQKRPCCQVCCPSAQGPRYRRRGDLQGHQDRQAQEQELEADG